MIGQVCLFGVNIRSAVIDLVSSILLIGLLASGPD